MNKPFSCGCCGELYPEMYRHTHHKIPTSVGGPDTPANKIELCPGCHDALHNVAYKLVSKKHSQSQVLDTVHLIYKDNKAAQKICMELAVNVRDAMIRSREIGLDPNHIVSITTSLRKQHKDLINLRCKELNVSQERYLRQLILIDLQTRFKGTGINISYEHEAVKAAKKAHSE